MAKSPKNNPIFGVSDFISLVNQNLEYSYGLVEIEGEVSSFKVNKDKYVFFDIKDQEGNLNCFMTIWQLRTPIEDGMKVIVSAMPKLTQWGKFSLTVQSIRPSGEGSIKKSFELLKNKLSLEGLFNLDRKRALPDIPGHVAIISSTQAAGYADFIKIIGDRWGGLKIDVANVQVQGSSAADQIIRAINYFNQLEDIPEAIAIIRGGGSSDDLSVFNDELLVRAVASSRAPIIVGVGHETDETLVDLAADVRASTPSNAAQILVPNRVEFVRFNSLRITSIASTISKVIDSLSDENRQNINTAVEKIEYNINLQMNSIQNLKNIISQLDPNKILKRGYAIIAGSLTVGELIKIETEKNIIKAEVKDVSKK